MKRGLPFIFLLLPFFAISSGNPKILVVTAHPDDESGMAGLIYKVTHDLKGTVDQCVITNGEGGYKYSTLANAFYGIELTDPSTGRENLPRIRKQELLNAGKIIGTSNIFFLDQKDARFSLDEHEPLDTSWNVNWVTTRLKELLQNGHYDYLLCLLPLPETHGGHKAATLLALEAVAAMPDKQRPVVLGITVSSRSDTVMRHFVQLKDYKLTRTDADTALFRFDRTQPFGYMGRLNYKIVVNWEIAEHKSQGVMQLGMNQGDFEDYWYFAVNQPSAREKCKAFFDELKRNNYKKLEY